VGTIPFPLYREFPDPTKVFRHQILQLQICVANSYHNKGELAWAELVVCPQVELKVKGSNPTTDKHFALKRLEHEIPNFDCQL
jgi:hypothetical protein